MQATATAQTTASSSCPADYKSAAAAEHSLETMAVHTIEAAVARSRSFVVVRILEQRTEYTLVVAAGRR